MKTRYTNVQQIFEQCSSLQSVAIINTMTENSFKSKEFTSAQSLQSIMKRRK